VTDVFDSPLALDDTEDVPVDTSDEFIPELSDVYELVDSAEDRITALVSERFDRLDKMLFAMNIGPDGETPVPVGALAVISAQSQYLGSNLLPAVAELHGKFDAVIADVKAFVQMVQSSRLPGLGKFMRGKGGVNDASQEEN
jgi:hypothetical protein